MGRTVILLERLDGRDLGLGNLNVELTDLFFLRSGLRHSLCLFQLRLCLCQRSVLDTVQAGIEDLGVHLNLVLAQLRIELGHLIHHELRDLDLLIELHIGAVRLFGFLAGSLIRNALV